MARIITTGTPGKDRILLEKGIVIAIRELAAQTELDENTYDLIAYIAISLKSISETIDSSVAAWEKRGYWVKADRYRMEWSWTSKVGVLLQKALADEDWAAGAQLIAQVTQKMSTVRVPQRNRLGKPWVGSWQRLKQLSISH